MQLQPSVTIKKVVVEHRLLSDAETDDLLIALTRQPVGGFLLTVVVAKLHRFCWKPQASSLRCLHIYNSASATLAKFKQVVLQISILVIVPVKPAEFRSQ